MKKISKRAWMALALAFALLAGLLVFFGEYFIEAKTWVAVPGSPHVYTGVNPDFRKIRTTFTCQIIPIYGNIIVSVWTLLLMHHT